VAGEVAAARLRHVELRQTERVLDPDDARPLRRREPDRRQRGVDRGPVGLEVDRQRRRLGWAAVMQFTTVVRQSIARIRRDVAKSASPMPYALPRVSAEIRTKGASRAGRTRGVRFRPSTFVSMPEPLMFFPISSTMRRSGRSTGSRGNQRRASTRSSFSRGSNSSGGTASTWAVSS
jgi:uncharacterized membrane protein YgcG